jgi:hypothetical protein
LTFIQNIQKWEEERWNTLLTSVKQFKSFQVFFSFLVHFNLSPCIACISSTHSVLQEVIPGVLETQTKELSDILDSASIETDLREFLDANKKAAETEETFEFVAYKSKFEDEEEKKESAPPAETPSNFSTQTAEEKIEASQKKVSFSSIIISLFSLPLTPPSFPPG